MSKIAFLGLGHMGAAMAERLLAAGHELTVYNRTASKAARLKRLGAHVADTPGAAASGAQIVFSMMGDDKASRHAWMGRDGALAALKPGAFAVECSTLSLGWVRTLSRVAKAKRLRYIDCPVTGIPSEAAAGHLILLVGAAPADLRAIRPVLNDLCKEIIHFGPVGAGTAYKLMVNLMGSVQLAALAEGLVIAQRAGLDRAIVVDALIKGAPASPQVIRNAKRMRDDDHDIITFPGKWRLKDTLYGVALARTLGAEAKLGQVAVRAFRRLIAAGYGELNESKIVDVLGAKHRKRA